jgi:hypothetical protein
MSDDRSSPRKWAYVEPGEDGSTPVYTIMTEDEILEKYFPYWKEQLKKVRPEILEQEDEDTLKRIALDDWIVSHWAFTVTDDTKLEGKWNC